MATKMVATWRIGRLNLRFNFAKGILQNLNTIVNEKINTQS